MRRRAGRAEIGLAGAEGHAQPCRRQRSPSVAALSAIGGGGGGGPARRRAARRRRPAASGTSAAAAAAAQRRGGGALVAGRRCGRTALGRRSCRRWAVAAPGVAGCGVAGASPPRSRRGGGFAYAGAGRLRGRRLGSGSASSACRSTVTCAPAGAAMRAAQYESRSSSWRMGRQDSGAPRREDSGWHRSMLVHAPAWPPAMPSATASRSCGCRCGLAATTSPVSRGSPPRGSVTIAARLAHQQQPGRHVPAASARVPRSRRSVRPRPRRGRAPPRRTGGCRRPAASAPPACGRTPAGAAARHAANGMPVANTASFSSRRAETRRRRSFTKAPPPFSAQNISSDRRGIDQPGRQFRRRRRAAGAPGRWRSPSAGCRAGSWWCRRADRPPSARSSSPSRRRRIPPSGRRSRAAPC